MPDKDFISHDEAVKQGVIKVNPDPTFISHEDAAKAGWLDQPSLRDPNVINLVPPEEQVNTPRDLILRIARGMRPIVTMGAGSLTGIPAGVSMGPAAGTLVGAGTAYGMDALYRNFLESLSGKKEPNLFTGALNRAVGNAPGSPMERLTDPLGAVAENELGNALTSKVINPISEGFLKGLGSLHNPVPVEGFKQFPNIPADYPMLTGGTGEGIARLAANPTYIAHRVNTQKIARATADAEVSRFTGVGIDPFDIINKYQGDVKRAAESVGALKDKYAKQASSIGRLPPNIVLPGNGTVVEGPIYPNRAVAEAEAYLKEYERKFGEDTPGSPIPLITKDEKNRLANAKTIVDTWARNRDRQGNIVPDSRGNISRPMPYDAATDTIGVTKGVRGKDQQYFKDFGTSLDEDIKDSFAQWNAGSSDALKAYENAKAIAAHSQRLYEQGDIITKMKNGEDIAPGTFSNYFDTPQKVAKALSAGQDRKVLQGYLLGDLINAGGRGEKFNANALEERWTDPNKQAIYKMLYNSEERSRIGALVQVLKNTSQTPSNAGMYSTVFQVGKGAAYLSALALGGLLGGGFNFTPYAGMASMVTGATIPLNQFAKKVLLNPKLSREIVFGGMKIPARSPQGQFIGKTIMGALEGSTINLLLKDGSSVPAEVSGGQIVPENGR